MINVGDRVVVKDLSGLLRWSETTGIYPEYTQIRNHEFTVEMNDLRIPMRRIVKPHFDKVYMANLSLVNNGGERFFTCDSFVEKIPNTVTFLEAVDGMRQGYIYRNTRKGSYYIMRDGQIHTGFKNNLTCSPTTIVFDGSIIDYTRYNEKIWEKVS